MNPEDLAFLSDHVATIEGQRPERLGEVHAGIRRARLRRAAGTTAGASVLALLAVGVGLNLPSDDKAERPIGDPTRTPTASATLTTDDGPPGQRVIEADFTPDQLVDGLEAFGSLDSKPGDVELHANLPYAQTNYASMAGYCRGSSNLWWVGNATYGQCSPDAPLEPTPPVDFQPSENAPFELGPPPGDQESPIGMWLTGPLTPQVQKCIRETNSYFPEDSLACVTDAGIALVRSADASFGITAYRHRAPTVVTVLGTGFEAQANLDGTNYVFDHAVVSATGADRLETTLEASDHRRLVLVVIKGRGVADRVMVDGARGQFPQEHAPGSAWYSGRANQDRVLVEPGSHHLTLDLTDRVKAAAFLVFEAED